MSSFKLTAKEERFCIEFAKGVNASDAYRVAYNAKNMKPETINNKAYALLKKGGIRARIDELKAPVIEKAQITLESHLKELAKIRDAAFKDKEYSAATTAETNRGKAAGLYTTKIDANVDASLTVEIVRFGKD